jgi:hypothetical protein
MFNFLQQQDPNIDPRAAYEQQSILADTLLNASQQYQGGGAIGALAMLANAFQSRRAGDRAQGSLSAALEREQQKAMEAAQAEARAAEQARRQEWEDFIRKESYKRENPGPTSLQQNAGFANIEPGSPEARALVMGQGRGPTVNVNTGEQGLDRPELGNIPPGYQATFNPQTGSFELSAVPGGPVEAEREEDADKAQGRSESRQRAGQTVLRAVTRGLEFVPEIAEGDGVAGASARKARALVPGTAEYNMKLQVDDMLSNVGLDTLQAMRENSPTGGALGQVPIQQQQRLEQVLGSFDIAQSPEVIAENFNQINNIYLDIMFGSMDERAQLVESGQLDPRQNEAINQQYRQTAFDEFGRRREQPIDDDALINKYL